MRAVVLSQPERVRLDEVAPPRVGPGQILVQLAGCGICGSNLPVWEGRPWFTYPLEPGAPGHEGWGTVAELGPGVAGFDVGQPVALLSFRAFAEFDVADADAVVPLPSAIADRRIPAEALGCAVNVTARSDIREGDAVAVVGIGFLGALLVRLATLAGARVTAIGRRPFALDVARACGAVATIRFDSPHATVSQARAAIDGGGYDRVIEAAGAQASLDIASALPRERGRLVIAGYHQDGSRQVDMQSWNWRGIDVVNAHERSREVYVDGMRTAIALIASGQLDVDPLLTHTYPLANAAEAFRAAATRPDGFLKAVVSCHD